jgi:hypothetical protein
VAGGEGDQAGVFVDQPEHVDGADAAEFAGVDEADFDAALGEGGPGVDVGGVVVEVGDDVVAFADGEACGDVAEGERGGADEGDFVGLSADEAGGEFAGVRTRRSRTGRSWSSRVAWRAYWATASATRRGRGQTAAWRGRRGGGRRGIRAGGVLRGRGVRERSWRVHSISSRIWP